MLSRRHNRPYSRCQSLTPSLVFLNRASYGRRRNNDVTSQEREVTMKLRHSLRTDAQICGKSATQAYLFVRHGLGVNMVYLPIKLKLRSNPTKLYERLHVDATVIRSFQKKIFSRFLPPPYAVHVNLAAGMPWLCVQK